MSNGHPSRLNVSPVEKPEFENVVMKKLLLIISLAALAAVAYVVLNAGGLVKSIIESVGSDVTGVAVTVDSVEIGLTDGKASIKGLNVGNPPGFESAHAFALGEVSVDIHTGSLGGDAIHIEEVIIDGPSVIYEMGTGGSNIDVIQQNVAKFTGPGGGESGESPDDGEGQPVIIDRVLIKNVRVAVSASFLAGEDLGTTIPEIEILDIGKDDGGAGPAEVVQLIIEAITNSVGGAVELLDLDALKDKADEALSEAADEVKGKVDEALQGAGEKIGDLFGGKDDG